MRICIVAPDKGPPYNEAWRNYVRTLAARLGWPLLTTGEVPMLWQRRGRTLILRNNALLYPAFLFLAWLWARRHDRVLLECKPGTIYFETLVNAIGSSRTVYDVRDSYWFAQPGFEQSMSRFPIVVTWDEDERYKGIATRRITLAPGVSIPYAATPTAKGTTFTLLFASAPLPHHNYPSIFEEKGIFLLLEGFARAAVKRKQLILAWRGAFREELDRLIRERYAALDIEVVEGEADMRALYQRSHATIIVSGDTQRTPQYPASLMESLRQGTPAIISANYRMAAFVKAHGVGVVCEPTNASVSAAITRLHEHYRTISARRITPTEFDINTSIDRLGRELASV